MMRHARIVVLGLVGAVAASRVAPAQAPDPLAPVAFLAGGTWVGAGQWPDGSVVKVEVQYRWGPTRRLLHFDAYDVAAGVRRLLYEGLIFFDPRRGNIVQWNVKPTGDLTESEVTRADTAGYDVRGRGTWSLIRHTGPDVFRWELRVPQDGAWQPILHATYRRRP